MNAFDAGVAGRRSLACWARVTAASAGAMLFSNDPKDVFALALSWGGTPWTVVEVRFDPEPKGLNIEVDFSPASLFSDPESGRLQTPCKGHAEHLLGA